MVKPLPTGWRWTQLGELAADVDGAVSIGPFGSRMKAETYSESGVRVIRGVNISNTRAWRGDWVYVPREFASTMPKCIVKAGDLVLPHRGSIGEVAIVPGDDHEYILSTSLMKISLDQSVACPEFIFYYLRSRRGREEIMRFSSQVGTPGIGQPLSSLRQFAIPLPPRDDQDEIVEVLRTLDEKIDLNRRTNETLEAMAQAVFKSWFVDFDPVHAKAAGKAPAHMDAETAALFPDAFGEDGLPLEWEVSTIGDEVTVVGGSTPSTKQPEYWAGGTHNWATPKDLSDLGSTVLLSTARKLTDAGVAKISSGLLPAGTLLMSSRAPIGYLAISEVPVAVNQGFAAMKCEGRLSEHYMLIWCQMNQELVLSKANGSTFLEISKSNFKSLPVLVPDAATRSAFDRFAEPLRQRYVLNVKENQTLAALRDLLLPKLMSGELRLRDAEKIVEGAA